MAKRLETKWPPWMAILLLGAMVNSAVANVEFYLPLGCFIDNPNRPDLNQHSVQNEDSTAYMKNWCAATCNALGHPYGGLQMATKCFCGDDYASYGFSNGCNYTCASGDTVSVDQCGGVMANSVIYTVDSDPAKRISRIHKAYTNPLSFVDARKECVHSDGDLVTFVDNTAIDALVTEIVTNGGNQHGEYWIGLRYSQYYGRLSWVNPTSQGMSELGINLKLTNPDGAMGCVVLDTQTKSFRNIDCTANKMFFCKQVPPPVDATDNPDEGSASGDGGSSWLPENGRVIFFVVLPLFLIIYGGSCIVYIIGKSWRYCRKKQRLARLKELAEDHPSRPLTSRDITLQSGSPPPPYYRANSRGRRLEESKQPLVTTENETRAPSRNRRFKHEDEQPTESDPAIDFSKLSIQDIIYIKSLMGERRPAKKKKEILVA